MRGMEHILVRANREWRTPNLRWLIELLDGFRFLWKAHGDGVRVFSWTGKNDYVALCEPESISFGGGCVSSCTCWNHFLLAVVLRDGYYGLYLDETLYEGSSARCPTFDNDSLCASAPSRTGTATFECVGLEVWGVGP